MRKSKIFRSFAVGFMLMLLAVLTPMAGIAGTPPPVPPVQTPEPPPPVPPPEIGAGLFTDDYFERRAITDQTRERKDSVLPDGMFPSAVEGQPRTLDVTAVRKVAVRPGYPQTLYATLDYGQGLWRSTNGGDFWEPVPIGIGGGFSIVFANSSTAVATFGYDDGVSYVNGGIWHTSDGGSTWYDVSAGIDNTVVAIAFDPTNPARIYAGTYEAGIYRGDYSSGSVTWEQINSGLGDDYYIYSIAVSPTSPNVLYIGGYDEVYYSEDYGTTWSIADNNYPSKRTEAVAVHPTNPDVFYTGARRLGLSTGLSNGGFYRSTDGPGDDNLILRNIGMQNTFVLDIAQDPVYPNILYAGTWASGFFKSEDYGQTWVEKNVGLTLPYIYGIEAVRDPGNPGGTILYVATFYFNSGVFVSTDRGENWSDPWGGAFPNMFDITTTIDAYTLAAATNYGVFVSSNGGVNWGYSQGLTDGYEGIVLELARDPNNPYKLLAATYSGGIWTSTNAGYSWTETSGGIGGNSVVFDLTFRPGSSSTAYAASWGVWRTTNGGSTWAALGTLPEWVRDVDGLGGPSYDLFAGTNDAGVYRSLGATGPWTDISGGLADPRIRSLKALTSNQVFAGTNGSNVWEYNGVFWTQKGPEIRAPGIRSIAIDPYTSSTIYATTDQGVYKSTNGGETWMAKNQGLGGYGDLVVNSISIDPTNTSIIYLGTWGYGIFKSTDGGDHWTRLADPLKCSKVYLPVVQKNYAPPAIINGDFELGPGVGWGQYADHGYNIIRYYTDLLVPPRSGYYATWLGGALDNFSVIWQNVVIPTSDPTLRFYHWDASADTCGNDFGYVYINGGYPYHIWDLCNDTYGWVRKTVDLSAFAGQAVEVAIGAYTDEADNSNSFIDDVTLGSTRLADFGVQEVPLAPDPAATYGFLWPDTVNVEQPAQELWFLPLRER